MWKLIAVFIYQDEEIKIKKVREKIKVKSFAYCNWWRRGKREAY